MEDGLDSLLDGAGAGVGGSTSTGYCSWTLSGGAEARRLNHGYFYSRDSALGTMSKIK